MQIKCITKRFRVFVLYTYLIIKDLVVNYTLYELQLEMFLIKLIIINYKVTIVMF